MQRVVGSMVAAVLTAGALASEADAAQWVAAWGAPINGSATSSLSNATVRDVARVTLGGDRIRIRLSNAFGTTPMHVGAASVALQKTSPEPGLVAGSSRPVTFGGSRSVTIPPKTDLLYSDPVDLPVAAQQNVAVSLFLPDGTNPGAGAAAWNTSFTTANGAGDKTGEDSGASFTESSTSPYGVTAIDVLTDEADGAVVGLGSSTFHGNNSTTDGFDRVLDLLSVRIDTEIGVGQRKGIVSAGIGGDPLHAGMNRLTRDVFSQTAVAGVMVYDVNDLASRKATEIEDDYRKLIAQAHARAVRVYCPTWPPAAQSAPSTISGNERRKLNTWILQSGECYDIVDWDAVLRGAVVQDEYDPLYFSDGIHPNPAGHKAMADATPLRWYRFAVPAPASPAPAAAAAPPRVFASALGLPAPRRCVSRRNFAIHVLAPRGQ